MRIVLVTNINGKGLQLDAELLSGFLVELGHEVDLQQFDVPLSDVSYDLGLALEVVNENMFQLAKKWVWVPNLEWSRPEFLIHARKFDRIWAKTLDTEKVLRNQFPHVTYTGFLSRDRRNVRIERERKFLHVGGDSGLKNTNAVIAAWRQWKYWAGELDAPLTVISRSIQTDVVNTDGITFLKEVSDTDLANLQNSHLFHLQPSAYEGWGHAIRESQSVGAVLLTTRAGPMAELHAPFEVDPTGERKVYMATAYNVSGREIREKVGVMLEQPSQMIAKYQVDMRGNWEQEYRESRRRMEKALVEVMRSGVTSSSVTPSGVKPVLAILGNFRPEHSTENDLLWSLNDMGYEVRCFQEDSTSTDNIQRECEEAQVELLIFVHTHGWKTDGSFDLDSLWTRLRNKGTKTCSFHLDRYWGLNQLDRREDLIGHHAFWRTDRVFTADGGNDDKFRSRGVAHSWLPPGVVKRDCYTGTFNKELACDVGFVGATSYHPEWKFREELISFLNEVYGDRFRVFQGVRGDSLNCVYASGKIFVGDSCFGGADFYFSDRCVETPGRGGLLIHHETKGLNIPGMPTYRAQSLLDLRDKIDWWLEQKEEFRYQARNTSQRWVAANETYSNRMNILLRSMGVS